MVTHDPTLVAERLDASRKNLLDTSRRNRLINYRPARASGLDIVGEAPDRVFQSLVVEGRAMTFAARSEPTSGDSHQSFGGSESLFVDDQSDAVALYEHRALAEQELAEYLGHGALPANQSDLVLQTSEGTDRLKSKLLKIHRDARTAIEETGVNVLFLALGMLEWQEEDEQSTPRKSPLVLVPVELEPTAKGAYRIRHDGGEIGGNLSLQAMMLAEYGIRLPSLPDLGMADILQYLNAVGKAISSKTSWRVDASAIALGFFSYAKYLLYMDLAEVQWPEDRKPTENEILGALLDVGFQESEPGYPDIGPLDPLRPVAEIYDVINADSSQTLAIMEANRGRSMVIQGPPGTGKSQTITNLIASSLARGKTVLFVSEKLAALNVVARSLERVGLRDACLELHSQKARKAEFYQELRRVQELGQPMVDTTRAELELFESHRRDLNEYCAAANELLRNRGISPRDAMGKLVRLGPEDPGLMRLEPGHMVTWIEDDFQVRLPLVQQLEAKVRQIGPPCENPFFGSRMTLLIGMDVASHFHAVTETVEALRRARSLADSLSRVLHLDEPTQLEGVGMICRAAKRAAEAPRLEGVALDTSAWVESERVIEQAIQAGRVLSSIKDDWSAALIDTAWETDVGGAIEALAEHGHRWYRVLYGEYRAAVRLADGLSRSPLKNSGARSDLLKAISEAQKCRQLLADAQELCKSLFGVQWHGETSDWDALQGLTDWIVALHRAVGAGEIPAQILPFLQGFGGNHELASAADTCLVAATVAVERIRSLLARLEFGEVPAPIAEGFESAELLLARWIAEPERLDEIVGLNKLASELKRLGEGEIVSKCYDSAASPSRLVECFQRTWYEGLVREAFASRPALAKFDRARHEQLQREFRELDDGLQRFNRARIRLRHYEGVPRSLNGGSAAWLQRQMAKKIRHEPIRKAMSEARGVIQAIKPVFMMSPLSIAMYLPQDGPSFDVVIFDEASQVKPEDAFGAVLRGSQVIVVGDSKQMPPTSFFDRVTGADDELDEEEQERNITRDMESILSLMEARLAPRGPGRRMLRWHYRSRHHTLIEPSNALFYDYSLWLVPNPHPPDHSLGLRLHRLDTEYDRGASRTNRKEARAVAEAVCDHVRHRPQESLMVVAFSQAQQQAIQDELDLFLSKEPAFFDYADRHPTERLDVKNLENVQGDERDVVYISVGYGKDATGFASMSFGPLNKEGGERRLNVLITRARCRCEVFTNLRSDDVRTEASASIGLAAFKEFLRYAESGFMNVAQPTGREPGSPFEEAVIRRLEILGYSTEPQVGCAGFFIDIGVRDPASPGSYVLGIECDGAQYHSCRTARDRDKLRQLVLEARGWRIHRIWSTDWFAYPDRELRRVIEAIEGAKLGRANDLDPVPVVISQNPTLIPPPPLPTISRTEPYVCAAIDVPFYCELHQLGSAAMADLVRRVVAVESPVHEEEVVRRIREAGGVGRAGARIRYAIGLGIQAAAGPDITYDRPFLIAKASPLCVRDRSGLPQQCKKLEYVSDSELALAVEQTVEEAFEILSSEIAPLAVRKLGFDRATQPMRDRIEKVVSNLLKVGRMKQANDRIAFSGARGTASDARSSTP